MSLNVGGVEKSLVNLLNMIDYKKYSVDLLLFQRKGAFLKQIPGEVNLIEEPNVKILFQSALYTIFHDKKSLHNTKLLFIRCFASVIEKLRWKQYDQIRLHRWIDFYSKNIPNNSNGYDVAVAYSGGETAYYIIDKVNAGRKVYYFHSDYSKIDIDAELEGKYVNQADIIVTISDVCKQSLDHLFPKKKDVIVVLSNLSSQKLIWQLAKDYFPSEFQVDRKKIKIVSVGRLDRVKGFDMAVEAANILKQSGIDFCWIIVGEGVERKNLEKQIKKYGLENQLILVGLKENPYPYILNADLLIQTSHLEGKSVVLDEAKILKTPAIITNYNSAHDQINDGIDGLIVDMSAEGIADGILLCAKDMRKIKQFSDAIVINKSIECIDEYMNILMG